MDRAELRAQILPIVAESLGVEPKAMTDNTFACGHSIIQAVNLLERIAHQRGMSCHVDNGGRAAGLTLGEIVDLFANASGDVVRVV